MTFVTEALDRINQSINRSIESKLGVLPIDTSLEVQPAGSDVACQHGVDQQFYSLFHDVGKPQ